MTEQANADAELSAAHFPYRRLGLAAAFVLFIGSVDTWTSISDHARLDKPVAAWEAVTWEFSSLILIICLIPAVGWLNRRFSIHRQSWLHTAALNVVATLPFSIVHVVGMVLLRKAAYAAAGHYYHFGAPVDHWFYEYRKDVVTYLLILVFGYGFHFYRFYQKQMRAGKRTSSPVDEPLKRLVVKKHNREFILNVADIDQIEADGNYVTVFSHGSSYSLRESMKSLETRLDPHRFTRIHRRHIVNMDHIREIQPWNHGDYRVVLKDGTFVNFSRRYRDRLNCLPILTASHQTQSSLTSSRRL